MRIALSKLIVTLKYEDIYGRKMATQERHLGFFTGDSELDLKPSKPKKTT